MFYVNPEVAFPVTPTIAMSILIYISYIDLVGTCASV